MKKQITLLLSSFLIGGIANAQTPDPGSVESLETLNRVSTYPNSKNVNSNTEAVGLSQIYSTTGFYTISADGIGSTASSMSIRVNKPNAAATVQKAILMSAVTFSTISNGCVTLSGVPVNWNGSASSGSLFNNYWADVTSIVAAQINSFPAGISNLTITECNSGRVDGEALLVVFNDAAATEKTIIVMFGAANPAGDNFSVTLAQPIDPSQPGALLDMGLGIGFGFQGSGQTSQVSVNGQRLSTAAGGQDDGAGANGALITVGGIGDVNTNPANPFAGPTNPRSDDELYNILPFITNTTTGLTITTLNPSRDDNIFLTYFSLSGAAIIGEGILLSQTNSSGNVGTTHTVKAVVKNTLGQPIPNKLVTFSVTSGPNSGLGFSANTNMSGEVSFTYTGSGSGAGIDNIVACFSNSQNQLTCSNVLSFQWIAPPDPPTISCPANITVNNASGFCGANVSYPPATASGFPTATITYSHASGSFFPVGNTTVTATASNVNGSASCQFVVTVIDNESPVITCPADENHTADPGLCSYSFSPAAATATDNCPGVVVNGVRSDALGLHAPYPVGTTIITWTATDAYNHSVSCQQRVIVTDDEDPFITAPNLFLCYEDGGFGCSVVLGGSAIDNCDLLSLVNDHTGCFPVGETTVTWTATDIHGNISTKTQTVTRNPEINITICAGPRLTIYTGMVSGFGPFGPQSVNLDATASGGTAGYSYNWSPATGLSNPNIANPVASPTVTTTYELTVTDSKGCTRTLSITVSVLPLSSIFCSGTGNNVKFSVCHMPPGNPSNPQNICISANAIDAHLTTGSNGHNNCYLGPCMTEQLCFSTEPAIPSFARITPLQNDENGKMEMPDAFNVRIYPNPSNSEFRILVSGNNDQPTVIRILDVNGVIKSTSGGNSEGNSFTVGGDLKPGIYMAEVSQGKNRQVIKLIKVN